MTIWVISCNDTPSTCLVQEFYRAQAKCNSWAQFPELVLGYLSRKKWSKPLLVKFIGLNESGKFVGIGRRDDMEWIFIKLEVGLFAVAKT